VGGPSVNKTIGNTLRQLVSKNLTPKIRFTDKSGKTSFGQLRLAKAVRSKLLVTNTDKS
jgi:hypothetical protein